MKITKRRLKQIIREEYSAIKKQKLLSQRTSLRESKLKRMIRRIIKETTLSNPQYEFEEDIDLNDDGNSDLDVVMHMKALKSKKKKEKKSSASGKDMR